MKQYYHHYLSITTPKLLVEGINIRSYQLVPNNYIFFGIDRLNQVIEISELHYFKASLQTFHQNEYPRDLYKNLTSNHAIDQITTLSETEASRYVFDFISPGQFYAACLNLNLAKLLSDYYNQVGSESRSISLQRFQKWSDLNYRKEIQNDLRGQTIFLTLPILSNGEVASAYTMAKTENTEAFLFETIGREICNIKIPSVNFYQDGFLYNFEYVFKRDDYEKLFDGLFIELKMDIFNPNSINRCSEADKFNQTAETTVTEIYVDLHQEFLDSKNAGQEFIVKKLSLTLNDEEKDIKNAILCRDLIEFRLVYKNRESTEYLEASVCSTIDGVTREVASISMLPSAPKLVLGNPVYPLSPGSALVSWESPIVAAKSFNYIFNVYLRPDLSSPLTDQSALCSTTDRRIGTEIQSLEITHTEWQSLEPKQIKIDSTLSRKNPGEFILICLQLKFIEDSSFSRVTFLKTQLSPAPVNGLLINSINDVNDRGFSLNFLHARPCSSIFEVEFQLEYGRNQTVCDLEVDGENNIQNWFGGEITIRF